jgi:hypothetical protein
MVDTELICDECSEKATQGSYKRHYCKKCFEKKFDNDYNKFFKWWDEAHD